MHYYTKEEITNKKINLVKFLHNDEKGNSVYFSNNCVCDRCGGLGEIPAFHNIEDGTCFKCDGRGFIEDEVTIIPDREVFNEEQRQKILEQQRIEETKRRELNRQRRLKEGFVEFDSIEFCKHLQPWFLNKRVADGYINMLTTEVFNAYKVSRETDKAICYEFLESLEDDCTIGYKIWIPKSAFKE